MRIHNKFRETRGFVSAWRDAVRFRYMINPHAFERCRILVFWEKHGDTATIEAFRVSRRTLYRWAVALRKEAGKLEGLNPRSTAPKRKRRRVIPDEIRNQIIALRTKHPRIGKEKIAILLAEEGYRYSVSTIGRILTDLKKQGILVPARRVSMNARTGNVIERSWRPKKSKLRRPYGYRVLEVDTVVRFIDGVKRYVLTAVDTQTRIAFAGAYTNHGSASAADFLQRAREVIPDCPRALQTDNGSEFALHFTVAVSEYGLTHFHTYPRSPKMNAHVERFNRTLEEEFLRYHRGVLRNDVAEFNRILVDWLIWYNAKRPHHALGLQSPLRAMLSAIPTRECHMWWTNTKT